MKLRNDLLLNKRLMSELYEKAEEIEEGDFLTKEEFPKKRKIKIH